MTAVQLPALAAKGISKRFGATCALHDANLTVHAGQVHALMGENGAGKSTLVKMLVGALQPDNGSILVNGIPAMFRSVRDALAAGVVPVYQHSTLFPELTVAENLSAFDCASDSPLKSRRPEIGLDDYMETAARVGLALDPQQSVSKLSMAERQLLEITRGVARRCNVLLLDEPTAALNTHEAERLFAALDGLRRDGKAIIFISHKLNEISQICNVVTVLRDGRTVMDAEPIGDLTHQHIVEAMVGPVSLRSTYALPATSTLRLEAVDLASDDAFQPISLSAACGEIIGITGLIGSGALAVGEVLAGARTASSGSLRLDGVELGPSSRKRYKRQGIGFVPADRTSDGIFSGLSCATNAMASAYSSISKASFLTRKSEIGASRALYNALHVKPSDPAVPIAALSGGNQQKVIIIRNLLLPRLKVLIVLEPTRGVDVHARAAIHQAILDCARNGISVVIVSSDLDEVLSLSHKVYVMHGGRVAGMFPHGARPDHILACIGGAVDREREAGYALA